jgi:hypothetical protein
VRRRNRKQWSTEKTTIQLHFLADCGSLGLGGENMVPFLSSEMIIDE